MEPPQILSPDAATRSTDNDALISRISAAKLGYITDNISSYFLPRRGNTNTTRPALINIGTHARIWAIDEIVRQFLNGEIEEDEKGKGKEIQSEKKQILSLGSGSDGRYWRMKEEYNKKNIDGKEGDERKGWNCKWLEIDFVEATSSKCRTIWGKPTLKNVLEEGAVLEKGGTGILSPDYHLLSGDLREFTSTLSSEILSSLDPSIPTLLLAECVLVYLPPETNTEVLSWFTQTFNKGSVVSYDPFGLQDNFGKVMVRNLATRNLSLPSAESTPTLDSLSQRLLSNGFHSADSLSIKKIRESVIPPEETARVAKIEMLDEVEELNLVLDHYAITWGKTEEGISIGLVLTK